MKNENFKFNYCIPREYKDKETGEIRYCLCRGNESMGVDTLENIQKFADESKPKDAQPWGQVFNNGYRVTSDSVDYSEWCGFTFNDIDSKWFYDYNKPFNVQKLLEGIVKTAETLYYSNFYAVHLSNSKKGYRIFWYWNCERTKENFIKCCILSEKYTKEVFYSMGEQTRSIIDYCKDGKRVLDRCSKSIFQGFYVTVNKIYYSSLINTSDFGSCDISDINIEDIYKVSESTFISNSSNVNIKYLSNNGEIKQDEIRYYPHQHRRCLYEALIVLFKDKSKVDEEWKRICMYLPQTDGFGNGHNTEFYKKEPDRNRWFDRFNKKTVHKCDWLKPFGYVYEDESEYVYWDQFQKSWKKHSLKEVNDIVVNEILEREYNTETMKQKDIDRVITEIREKIFKNTFNNIFNRWYDENIKKEDNIYRLEDIRKSYYKTRWSREDFKYLCYGYSIPQDIVTYKMYADFYYRDKDNLPIIKYDLLEDEVKLYSYWPENDKYCWHPFKYGNEYTHWKNNDTFINTCNKTDMLESVNKYTSRWHQFHIIKDYLNSLDLSKSDESLLETWAIRYFNADDTKLTREISKKFFIAAVKKMMVEDPSTFVFQHMLFLQGPTGCGKTFFLVTMFTIDGKMFILNKIDPNGKDNEIGPLIAKNWLIQFGESENLKKISVNAAKEFVDRINLGMKYQKKYENEQTTIYPRIVACRTSNDDVLFNDTSVDIDRRNWLIVCNNPMNSCGPELRNKIKEEKDILWATAYKLYLDNPDQDLELSNDVFEDLGKLQEDFKLVTKDDINELYDDIFNRVYLTNDKGEIQDEEAFNEMLRRSEESLQRKGTYVSGLLDNNVFVQEKKIHCIPAKWLSDYIKNHEGVATLKEFKKKLIAEGWEFGTHGWRNSTKKCWYKSN